MLASQFFNDDIDGEVQPEKDERFLWFISYVGDANSGCEDEYDCHDITFNAYCEAAQIITKHGYEVIDSYSEHDYVSATFRKVDTNPIPHDQRCKYCNGTGRWRDG
jgi:hypothetical protein